VNSALDAAYQVLTEAGEPLHYKEITSRILESGLWSTDGKTPAKTVYARLGTDIQQRGQESRFRRIGPGVFAVNSSTLPDSSTSSPDPESPRDVEKSLSFTDAAERILEQYGNRKPMHYREVTERALKDGMLVTQGKTPEATMYAQIITEIQRHTKRGELPRFTRHGKGYFGLTQWMGKGLAFQIEQHNREVRKQLLAQVRQVSPSDFEAIIGRLLTAMGFDQVAMTPLGGDGGIDVRGVLVIGDSVRIKMAVQVKRWKNNVQAPIVQQVRGSLGAHEQGLIVTTSDFSKGAVAEASRADTTPVGLMNGDQLVNLLIEHDIGVHRSSHDIIELGEDVEE
jgi:restriction system protein